MRLTPALNVGVGWGLGQTRAFPCGVGTFWAMSRPNEDGGTLRTILDGRRYMLQLSKGAKRPLEESGPVSQGRCRRFSRPIELALVYDGLLAVTRMQ